MRRTFKTLQTREKMLKRSTSISGVSVSTIVHAEKLKEFERIGYATFTENKPWVTASKLCAAGERIPVIFSDAAWDCERLRLWGWLVSAKIEDNNRSTTVHVHGIRPIRGHHGRTDLRLRNTGEFKRHYIRNYALCQTPDFITE
jgi:hypothetical protein